MIKAYRIVHVDYSDNPFSGEGAYERPGRFNPAGTYMVYTAESLSLAMLEIFVHMPYSSFKDKLNDLYLYIPCSFDEGFVKVLERKDLPMGWNTNPVPPSTREAGRKWLESGESLILKVPSVVNPIEFNYLINPKHPDFSKLIIGDPQKIIFDERLIITSGSEGIPVTAK